MSCKCEMLNAELWLVIFMPFFKGRRKILLSKINFFLKSVQKRLPKRKKFYIIIADFERSAAFLGVMRNHAAGYERFVNNGGKVLNERNY